MRLGLFGVVLLFVLAACGKGAPDEVTSGSESASRDVPR